MHYRGLLTLGVCAALAAEAGAQIPGLKLGEPVAPGAASDVRPEPRPLREERPDLPPRARLRYSPRGESRRLDDLSLAQAKDAERPEPPPKIDELFDYLRDRKRGDAEGRTLGLGRPLLGGDSSPSDRGGTTRLASDSKGWFSGERLGRIFGRNNGGLFESDHGFDQFTSPISNPFLFEDPRSLTEAKALFLYQRIPGSQPNFLGGDAYFGGLQARLAITERLSISMPKLGVVGISPQTNSAFRTGSSLSEIWLGPKYTFYRDADALNRRRRRGAVPNPRRRRQGVPGHRQPVDRPLCQRRQELPEDPLRQLQCVGQRRLCVLDQQPAQRLLLRQRPPVDGREQPRALLPRCGSELGAGDDRRPGAADRQRGARPVSTSAGRPRGANCSPRRPACAGGSPSRGNWAGLTSSRWRGTAASSRTASWWT